MPYCDVNKTWEHIILGALPAVEKYKTICPKCDHNNPIFAICIVSLFYKSDGNRSEI